jgi:hypothetical protein
MTLVFVFRRASAARGRYGSYKVANLRRHQLFLKLGLLLAAAAVAVFVLVLVKT